MNVNQEIENLKSLFPFVQIISGKNFMYSPKKNVVYYDANSIKRSVGMWSLCHELAHAKLNHSDFSSDIELLKMEVEAWTEARSIVKSVPSIPPISEKHIDKCLDTYRDWIYNRSLCPNCHLCAAQTDRQTYACINCLKSWKVPISQIDRIEKQTLLVG